MKGEIGRGAFSSPACSSAPNRARARRAPGDGGDGGEGHADRRDGGEIGAVGGALGAEQDSVHAPSGQEGEAAGDPQRPEYGLAQDRAVAGEVAAADRPDREGHVDERDD